MSEIPVIVSGLLFLGVVVALRNVAVGLERYAGKQVRCKRLKPDGGTVDGCGWQGDVSEGRCPECGSIFLREVKR